VTLLAFKACGASGNRRPVGSTPTHFRHFYAEVLDAFRADTALDSSS
jgi:hypothetical protein